MSTSTKKKVAKKAAEKPAKARSPAHGTVAHAWAEEFAENEGRAKSGGKPLTDDQLVERMQKRFPDRAESTTILRVSMARGCYNKGTGLFAKAGPAGRAGRPSSRRFDVDGAVVETRHRMPSKLVKAADDGEAPAKKSAEKPAKKVAKKVAKKAAKKAADAPGHGAEAQAEAGGP